MHLGCCLSRFSFFFFYLSPQILSLSGFSMDVRGRRKEKKGKSDTNTRKKKKREKNKSLPKTCQSSGRSKIEKNRKIIQVRMKIVAGGWKVTCRKELYLTFTPPHFHAWTLRGAIELRRE